MRLGSHRAAGRLSLGHVRSAGRGAPVPPRSGRRRSAVPARRTGFVLVALLIAGVFGAAGLLGAPLSSAAEPPKADSLKAEPLKYVALGDSSAAGPGIPTTIHTECQRSDRNWPHVLANTLGAELTDVTCTGATTEHFTAAQYSTAEPQFNKLTADTDLVTMAIGANDASMGWAFQLCPSPDGRTCQQTLAGYGLDFSATIAATASKVTTALQTIRSKSPNAQVIVVGYLTYWRPGGCYPNDKYSAVDANFLQSTFTSLEEALTDRADRAGATYVDIRNPSADHGLCESPGQRWLEGAAPVGAWPYHPNATGMANVAALVAGSLADLGLSLPAGG